MAYEKLEVRTVKFSKDILVFCNSEKANSLIQSIYVQLVKSATSIGANYAEANNAASKSDFRNKIFIAKKEAAETKYWLCLLQDLAIDREACKRLYEECHYLLMTFQKIINTLNKDKQLTYSKGLRVKG